MLRAPAHGLHADAAGAAQGSRQKLEVAMKALETQNVYEPDSAIYQNALNIIRSSSMNCYTFRARALGMPACLPVFEGLHVSPSSSQ